MQQVSQEDVVPWYRQFWPWFLMALPASAVIAGISTVIIATMNKDNLVVDNYYKQGLAINQTLTQQQVAKELGLLANVALDASGKIQLMISSAQPINDPVLKLSLVHATLAELDRVVFLQKESSNSYSGVIKDFSTGKWHFILEPVNAQWRIEANVTLPKQSWLLAPQV